MTSVSHSGRPSAGRACLRCFRHKRTLWGTASRTSLLNSDCKLTLTFEICFYSLCELPYRHSSNYLWLDRTFVDFKTILNLICHLDALFTEELCTPGLWASGESVAAVEGGEKKGQRWQGNGSSLSRRLCWSTAHHWWVPEESLEQTDGVAPYISHERRVSRNNTSMEMTCRRCNPGLPVCLALLRRASACRTFHIRQYNKQRLSLKPLWVRVWSVLSRYRMCAAGARLSLRSSSADQFFFFFDRMCDAGGQVGPRRFRLRKRKCFSMSCRPTSWPTPDYCSYLDLSASVIISTAVKYANHICSGYLATARIRRATIAKDHAWFEALWYYSLYQNLSCSLLWKF